MLFLFDTVVFDGIGRFESWIAFITFHFFYWTWLRRITTTTTTTTTTDSVCEPIHNLFLTCSFHSLSVFNRTKLVVFAPRNVMFQMFFFCCTTQSTTIYIYNFCFCVFDICVVFWTILKCAFVVYIQNDNNNNNKTLCIRIWREYRAIVYYVHIEREMKRRMSCFFQIYIYVSIYIFMCSAMQGLRVRCDSDLDSELESVPVVC